MFGKKYVLKIVAKKIKRDDNGTESYNTYIDGLEKMTPSFALATLLSAAHAIATTYDISKKRVDEIYKEQFKTIQITDENGNPINKPTKKTKQETIKKTKEKK